jgi:hypothetical protein
MLRNVRKTDKQGNPLEEPAEHQQDDLRVCCEYWISRHPTWIEPPDSVDRAKEPGLRAWEKWLKEQDEKYGKSRTDGSIPIGIAG